MKSRLQNCDSQDFPVNAGIRTFKNSSFYKNYSCSFLNQKEFRKFKDESHVKTCQAVRTTIKMSVRILPDISHIV